MTVTRICLLKMFIHKDTINNLKTCTYTPLQTNNGWKAELAPGIYVPPVVIKTLNIVHIIKYFTKVQVVWYLRDSDTSRYQPSRY